MGLSIGDSARTLPTFQRVGPLQGREPVRPSARFEPVPPSQGRVGPLSNADPEEIVQAALREPVSSAPAAAVRALGANLRAIRERQPTLEERSEEVRARFEQAREQIFGVEAEREAERAARQAEAAEAAADARDRTSAITERDDRAEIVRAQVDARPAPPEPVPPTPRALEPFDEPVPPGSFNLRG